MHLFTTRDGLSSDEIRTLYLDPDGTLWIGTFGGGLSFLRNGKFHTSPQKTDCSATTSAIFPTTPSRCGSAPREVSAASPRSSWKNSPAINATRLEPVNYGVEDGLRSASCAPSFPTGSGGYRTADGRIWFTTSRGLAVFDPTAHAQKVQAPLAQLAGVFVDQDPIDLSRPAKFGPHTQPMQIRFAGIHLSAPERVRYAVRLGSGPHLARQRRTSRHRLQQPAAWSLPFQMRAQVPGAPSSEQSFSFDVLPHFYEENWFRALLCAAVHRCSLGGLPIAASPDSLAVCACTGGTRQTGARDSRYPRAGFRGHLFATGCSRHVHARV